MEPREDERRRVLDAIVERKTWRGNVEKSNIVDDDDDDRNRKHNRVAIEMGRKLQLFVVETDIAGSIVGSVVVGVQWCNPWRLFSCIEFNQRCDYA